MNGRIGLVPGGPPSPIVVAVRPLRRRLRSREVPSTFYVFALIKGKLDLVDRGDEDGGGHGPDAGDGAQALDARIVADDVLDRLVGGRELAVEVAHHGEQGRDGGEPVAVLPEERPYQGDVAEAGADLPFDRLHPSARMQFWVFFL